MERYFGHILKYSRASSVLALLLFVLSLGCIQLSKDWLRNEQHSLQELSSEAPLYLPAVEYVKLVTLGFDNFVSDLLWFNTINYFGKQYQGERDYRWLAHMCQLVTSLDTKARHAYEFCGVLLAWEAKDFDTSNEILSAAIESEPDYWRYHYLRGFNYWYFLEDMDKAKEDMIRSAKCPDAPPFVAGIASRLLVDRQSIHTAIAFLKEALKNTNDPGAIEALTDKLNRAYLTFHKQALEKLVAKYNQQHPEKLTKLSQLVTAGLIRGIPKEPFGGKFLYSQETGTVVNTSGEKGLEFRGKTAKTGMFAHEFQEEASAESTAQ